MEIRIPICFSGKISFFWRSHIFALSQEKLIRAHHIDEKPAVLTNNMVYRGYIRIVIQKIRAVQILPSIKREF